MRIEDRGLRGAKGRKESYQLSAISFQLSAKNEATTDYRTRNRQRQGQSKKRVKTIGKEQKALV